MTMWILVLLGALIAVRDYLLSGQSRAARVSGLVLGIAISGVAGYEAYSDTHDTAKRDFRDATATVIDGGTVHGQLAAVAFGGGMLANPTGGTSRLGNAGDVVAEIDSASGRLLVDATLRDSSGTPILGVRKNEVWWDDDSGFDRNFTADAFEFFDRKADVPRLQIRLAGYVAIVNGIFYTAEGIPVVYTPRAQYVGPSQERVGQIRSELCAWFRYPSELHPGETDNKCLERSLDALDDFYARHPAAKTLLERGLPYTYEEYLKAVGSSPPTSP